MLCAQQLFSAVTSERSTYLSHLDLNLSQTISNRIVIHVSSPSCSHPRSSVGQFTEIDHTVNTTLAFYEQENYQKQFLCHLSKSGNVMVA